MKNKIIKNKTFAFFAALVISLSYFTMPAFALVPIANIINIPEAKILDKNKISLNEVPIEGSWYYDDQKNDWHFVHIDMYGNVGFLKNGCYKINTYGDSYYYMFDNNGSLITGLVRYNGNTYYFQETGLNRGSLYVGQIKINGITYEFDESGKMIGAMGKSMVKPIIKKK
ncbi:MAG: hypothetical protein IJ593_03805 [Lachnospiraceae bacterium]|nr:hypothetical protein [Lachnospiraceae bacterium]